MYTSICHLPSQGVEFFLPSGKFPRAPYTQSHHHPGLATSDPLSVRRAQRPFSEHCINGIIFYVLFCVWFLSLSLVLSPNTDMFGCEVGYRVSPRPAGCAMEYMGSVGCHLSKIHGKYSES